MSDLWLQLLREDCEMEGGWLAAAHMGMAASYYGPTVMSPQFLANIQRILQICIEKIRHNPPLKEGIANK